MEKITLEAVEEVMERANVEFPDAKRALVDSDGDVSQAVRLIAEEKATAMNAEWKTDDSSDKVSSANKTADASADTAGSPDGSAPEDGTAAGSEKASADDKTAADGSEDSGRKKTEYEKATGTGGEDEKNPVDELIEKLKELVKAGNVDRIVIKHGEQVLLDVPVNVGLIGSVIGLAAAPWAVIAAVVASFGFQCTTEIIKKDGTKEGI